MLFECVLLLVSVISLLYIEFIWSCKRGLAKLFFPKSIWVVSSHHKLILKPPGTLWKPMHQQDSSWELLVKYLGASRAKKGQKPSRAHYAHKEPLGLTTLPSPTKANNLVGAHALALSLIRLRQPYVVAFFLLSSTIHLLLPCSPSFFHLLSSYFHRFFIFFFSSNLLSHLLQPQFRGLFGVSPFSLSDLIFLDF